MVNHGRLFDLGKRVGPKNVLQPWQGVYTACMESTSTTQDTENQNVTTEMPDLAQPEPEQSLPPAPTPTPEPMPDTSGPTEPPTVVTSPKPKNSKKKLLVLLLVVLLAAAGAAYWYFQMRDTTTYTPQATTEQPAAPVELKPATVAYSFEEAGTGQTEGCGDTTSTTLYTRPIAGGERVAAGSASANIGFTFYDVADNHVVAVGSSCEKGGVSVDSVWYSADGGSTYESIYSGKKSSGTNGNDLGESISSVKIASDQSVVLVASTDFAAQKNTIKAVDLQTKKATDVASIDTDGVFIQGYNVSSKTIYYYTGCLQCDGSSRDKLMAYNTETKAETTLLDQTKAGTMGLGATFSRDFTKLLTIRGTSGLELGAGAPYTVQEYDVAKKTTRTIATLKTQGPSGVYGYTDDDTQLPYYVDGKNIYTVSADGKPTVTFEATGAVHEVYYLSSKLAVVSTGTYENFTVVSYDYGTKEAKTVLLGDNTSTTIFGVGFK
jgi:hypothetical protein